MSVVFRVENHGAAAGALLRARQRPAAGAVIGGNRHGRGGVDGGGFDLIGVKHGQGVGEVTRVDFLVGRVLVAHGPAVGRAGWRGDEEELAELRRLKVALGPVQLFLAEDGRWLAEVDPRSHVAVQESGALQLFADGDSIVVGMEGADDAPE